jgi:hypothetical protein
MRFLWIVLAGLLAVAAFASFMNIVYGVFPILFGKGPKSDLLKTWVVSIVIFVLSVSLIFLLELHTL